MRATSVRRSRVAAAGFAAAATAVFGLAVAVPAGAVSSSGRAVIVDGAGSSSGLNEGGSATPFSLRLPRGAACPGDSADANYRVQSFLLPAADDPGAIRWHDIAPVGKGRWALYDINTNPYTQALTAKAEKLGGPGPIINIPSFNFAVFLPPGLVVPGRYHIGIACSLYNVIVRYWVTDIAVFRVASDRPAELRWRALDPAPAGSRSGSALSVIVVAVVVLLVAGIGGRRLLSREPRAGRERVAR